MSLAATEIKMEGMVVKVEKIIKAIKALQEVCSEYDTCERCPLRKNSDECGIVSDIPSEWKLKQEKVFLRSKRG